jgi:uncharacterized protein (TIGR00369 family)
MSERADAQRIELMRQYVEQVDPQTVHKTLGISYGRLDPDEVTAETEVDERLFQHAGIVHGGVFVTLAESAASMCAALNVDIARFNVAGMEINANHLRRVTSGKLVATARPVHRGGRTHVYAVELHNDGELVCVSRCTMAVRERDTPLEVPEGA